MNESRSHFASQAASANENIRMAAEWCLSSFPNAPRDVVLRAGSEVDCATLLQMEANAFPLFDRPVGARRLLPYQCATGTLQSFGYLVKVVACTPRGTGAYMIAQVRNWSELHICEVVARPLHAEQRIRSAGALLLGVVARLGQQLRIEVMTAQVRTLDRNEPIPGYRSARIIAHDARHGLLPSPEQGILADGRLSNDEDVWLKGRPENILRILLRKFGGPALEACSDVDAVQLIGRSSDTHHARNVKGC